MKMKQKKYTTAPLPFMGQKRRFLTEVKKVLDKCPANATYVDLFGGSGLLSHTVKSYYPEASVIYNDYDNYRERLLNVEKTNVLIKDIRAILTDVPKDKKVPENEKKRILKRVFEEQSIVGYVDRT